MGWFAKRTAGGRILLVFGALVGLGALALVAVPQLRWRAHLVTLYATGGVKDIDFREMLAYMAPGSEQSLERLISTRNPFAVIRNFHNSPADVNAGGRLFQSEQCSNCHGADGSGGPGAPALKGRAFKNGESDWAIYRTIRHGVTGTAMAAHGEPDGQLWQLVAFVRSLSGVADASAALPARIASQVPFAELARASEPGADWLTYSGSYSGARHSALTAITPANVGSLGLRWIHSFGGLASSLEVSPLVREGVMYVTTPLGVVMALDAATGATLWTYSHKLPADVKPSEVGQVPNRGVALLDERVFFGTADGKVIALQAATGKQLWEVAVSPDPTMYYISSAPLAVRDLVVTGVGTRGGGRGFVVAYDAATGKERWRFLAIPAPGEKGSDTWSGDSWREGGAPTWLTGSYDPDSDLLVWGVGNPKPDYDNDLRKGDNLYTDSIVALSATTGKLAWYFQFTPADDHDWDACQIPIIVAGPAGSGKRVLWANRNGFYYVFDLATGRYLNGRPFVETTWADGLDASGRPQLSAARARSRDGAILFPGNVGGTNWWSPTYDATLNLVYVPVLEQGMVFYSSQSSWPSASGGTKFYTAVRALDPATGARVWEHRSEPRLVDSHMGGLLSTATGLVFAGDQSRFFALDAKSGAGLWSVETGGNINAAPVSYAANGEQYVIIAAGSNLIAFALPPTHAPPGPATRTAHD